MRYKWVITAALWLAFVGCMLTPAAEFAVGSMVIFLLSGWVLIRWIRRPDVCANGIYPRWLVDYLTDRGSKDCDGRRMFADFT